MNSEMMTPSQRARLNQLNDQYQDSMLYGEPMSPSDAWEYNILIRLEQMEWDAKLRSNGHYAPNIAD